MKKNICKVISVIMLGICIYAIVLCIKVVDTPVHGFLDFTDLALMIFVGVSIVSAIVAFITGKIGWANKSTK
ncbi:MAG: hypothetical protein IJB68_01925 [Ruminococcus sp.]|nr:hypothetical protein [Ruminococcus sp.]